MPYNPGVQDRSGEIFASYLNSAVSSIAGGITQAAGAIKARKEEAKKIKSLGNAANSIIKENEWMLGKITKEDWDLKGPQEKWDFVQAKSQALTIKGLHQKGMIQTDMMKWADEVRRPGTPGTPGQPAGEVPYYLDQSPQTQGSYAPQPDIEAAYPARRLPAPEAGMGLPSTLYGYDRPGPGASERSAKIEGLVARQPEGKQSAIRSYLETKYPPRLQTEYGKRAISGPNRANYLATPPPAIDGPVQGPRAQRAFTPGQGRPVVGAATPATPGGSVASADAKYPNAILHDNYLKAVTAATGGTQDTPRSYQDPETGINYVYFGKSILEAGQSMDALANEVKLKVGQASEILLEDGSPTGSALVNDGKTMKVIKISEDQVDWSPYDYNGNGVIDEGKEILDARNAARLGHGKLPTVGMSVSAKKRGGGGGGAVSDLQKWRAQREAK